MTTKQMLVNAVIGTAVTIALLIKASHGPTRWVLVSQFIALVAAFGLVALGISYRLSKQTTRRE